MFIGVSPSVATHFAPLGLAFSAACVYTHTALTGLKRPKIRVIPRNPRKSAIQTSKNPRTSAFSAEIRDSDKSEKKP